jgi:adenylate cyclase
VTAAPVKNAKTPILKLWLDFFRGMVRSMTRNGGWLYAYSLAVIACFLSLTVLLHLPHDVEHWSSDFVISKRSQHAKEQNRQIALVYISEATLAGYPYLSPIHRGLLADLITVIDKVNPKVIGLDIILDRDTEAGKDKLLQDAIRDAKAKIVLGAIDLSGQRKITQAKYFSSRPAGSGLDTGHLYFDERRDHFVVPDHVVRFIAKPFEKEEIERNPHLKQSFAAALAQAAGNTSRARSRLFEWLFPASSRIDWMLPPRDGSDTFLTVQAEDVLTAGKLPIDKLFENKIVLIGGNFADRDQHLIPLSASGDDFYSGLFIHAQILAQMLEARSIYELNWLFSVLLVLAGAYAGYRLGSRAGHFYIWLELASVAALFAIWLLAFQAFGIIFPYNLILIAALAGAAAGHYGLAQTHDDDCANHPKEKQPGEVSNEAS